LSIGSVSEQSTKGCVGRDVNVYRTLQYTNQ